MMMTVPCVLRAVCWRRWLPEDELVEVPEDSSPAIIKLNVS
jgi:hypothetical protein